MMYTGKKLIRVTTVPISLKVLLRKQLRFMSEHFDVIAVSSPGKALEEVQVLEGVRTEQVVMTRSITPLKDLKALWQLYRLFKREKPSIVHTHTPKAGLLGMIASRMAGVPVRMHTVAGMPLMENVGLKRKVLELVEKLTYQCATKVYPNSINLSEFILQNRYCKSGKLKVLGNGSSNGIDMDFFQLNDSVMAAAEAAREKHGITESDFVFLFIGRMVKDKGIEELVEAFNHLKHSYPNIKLLLVGPFEDDLDPLSPHTSDIIKQDTSIIHIDFQQDVRPYLAMSQVLTFPSYREGFPNVPMQAGCFHLPSIVTNINGCNEIIEHGQNGLIIPVKDAAALQKAMESIMVNQSLYMHLKANARKFISERYEQKRFWGLLLNEYKEQLESNATLSKLSQKTV